MNRKVLALTCAIGLSATMLTACGGQDNNTGNTRMNNANGYSQQQRMNRMNDNDINNGGNGVIPGGPTFGNGFGDRGVEETRGVGSNGTGMSGTSNGPSAANGTNGGMAGGR
jgi:hypothetical protein